MQRPKMDPEKKDWHKKQGVDPEKDWYKKHGQNEETYSWLNDFVRDLDWWMFSQFYPR
jgi:hypothetical protein